MAPSYKEDDDNERQFDFDWEREGLPDYLKPFREDLIVLVSSELVFPVGLPNPYDHPTAKPAQAPGVKPGVAQPQRALARSSCALRGCETVSLPER